MKELRVEGYPSDHQPLLEDGRQIHNRARLTPGMTIGIARVVRESAVQRSKRHPVLAGLQRESHFTAAELARFADGITAGDLVVPLCVATVKSLSPVYANLRIHSLAQNPDTAVEMPLADFDDLPPPESQMVRNFNYVSVGLEPLPDGLWVAAAVIDLRR